MLVCYDISLLCSVIKKNKNKNKNKSKNKNGNRVGNRDRNRNNWRGGEGRTGQDRGKYE